MSLSFHQFNILNKYKLLNWENLIILQHICLVYKILHGLAPPPLCTIYTIPLRKTTFSQALMCLLERHMTGTHYGKQPESPCLNSFKHKVKKWLLNTQKCKHRCLIINFYLLHVSPYVTQSCLTLCHISSRYFLLSYFAIWCTYCRVRIHIRQRDYW